MAVSQLGWMKWPLAMVVLGGIGGALVLNGVVPWPGKNSSEATTSADVATPTTTKPQPEVAITVAQVTPRAVQRWVRVVGTLHGQEEIDISPEVDGRVRRILHDVGDIVRPGETLLEIDDTDFRLAVEEAGRSLDLELAKLGLRQPPAATFDVKLLPSVVKAGFVEQNAGSNLQRYQSLSRQKVTTADELEKAEMNYRVSQTDTQQRLIEAEQTLAAVRHQQAMLATITERLKDAQIVAPLLSRPLPQVSGTSAALNAPANDEPVLFTIAERSVSEGELVRASPPTKLFRLVIEHPLKLKAAAPERFASQVRVGQRVDLTVEAYPGETFAGVVARVNPTVDRTNRTFQIEITVPNSDRRLKAGAFTAGSVLSGEDEQAPTIPEEALVRFAGVTKVFVVEGDKVRAVPVEPGTRFPATSELQGRAWIEVRGDLPQQASVVTTGHSQLADGTKIRLREAKQVKDLR